MKEKVEMLALLRNTIGYFQDATRDLETLLESLSEDDFSEVSHHDDSDRTTSRQDLPIDLDVLYNKLTLKRAENALASGLRFYDRFKKSGGVDDGC